MEKIQAPSVPAQDCSRTSVFVLSRFKCPQRSGFRRSVVHFILPADSGLDCSPANTQAHPSLAPSFQIHLSTPIPAPKSPGLWEKSQWPQSHLPETEMSRKPLWCGEDERGKRQRPCPDSRQTSPVAGFLLLFIADCSQGTAWLEKSRGADADGSSCWEKGGRSDMG